MEFDSQLIVQFVECFPKFSEAGIFARPTNSALLAPIQSQLPAPFPPLFVQLLTRYRWTDVYLDKFRLLSNPAGYGFDGFAAELFSNEEQVNVLLPNGFIPFARSVDGHLYDPICFDTNRTEPDGDCPIVRLDHEAALIDNQIRPVEILAPSFRMFMVLTIAEIESRHTHRSDFLLSPT